MLKALANMRTALVSLVLIILMIGATSTAVNAAPMPGGVYIGWVYVNGVSVSDFTVGVSLGPTYYWTEYYPANDPIGSYEMDITIPDGGTTTGDIVCTVPGIGTQTLHNVDLTRDNTTCNWYFTTASPNPVVNFSADELSGTCPLTVQFTDTSVDATSWQWNFGDGTANATTQNPTHTFTNVSSYNVTLTAMTSAGQATVQKTGYINTQLLVSGAVGNPLALSMTDLYAFPQISENVPYNHHGTQMAMDVSGASLNAILNQTAPTSAATSVTFTGSDGFTNTASLALIRGDPNAILAINCPPDGSVRNIIPNQGIDGGWVRDLVSLTINSQAPVASFTASPLNGSAPLTVNFTDKSTNYPASWSWNFGDGNTSTLQNPSHTFSAAGTYTITLTATNAAGSNTKTTTGYIVVSPPPGPTANFVGDELSGTCPLTVQFTDASVGTGITSWQWNFGDGTANATTQNPSHVFTNVSSYNVTLTVTNSTGVSTLQRTGYVNTQLLVSGAVGNPLALSMADLYALPAITENVYYVSHGTPGWWNGTGASLNALINQSNPASGAYSVTFTGSDAFARTYTLDKIRSDPNSVIAYTNNTDAYLRNIVPIDGAPSTWIKDLVSITINQQAPTTNFTANATTGTAPLTVGFTDKSSLAASWSWNFGDGSTSTLQNPAHTFNAAGTYNVSLTTTNSAGSTTAYKNIVVNAAPLVPNAQVTGYSIPASMIAGQSYTATVTVKNTGNLPWNETSMFRLGMVGDNTGDAYKFNGVTARVWLPAGANVMPGDSVTFTFTMTAPVATGTYNPEYQMVWDGNEWFGDVVNASVAVTNSPLGAQITSTTIPASMAAGTSYSVSVTVKNTGSMAWNETSGFRLGMVGDNTGDAYKFDGTTARVWLPAGANVMPGHSVTFTFTMNARITPGTYNPQYQMVWEGHQWFGDISTTTVNVSGPDAVITGNTIPSTMTAGQTYNVSVTVQNTGSMPWNETSQFRLGMVGDNSGDAYKFDGTTARVWLPAGANVMPGQSVTFNYTMIAPAAGTYQPTYEMVWEGQEWFGQTLSKQVVTT